MILAILGIDYLPKLEYAKFNLACLRKLVTINLIAFSVMTVNSFSLEKPATASEIYLDKNCGQNQELAQIDRFIVFYQSEFRTNGKNYWLSAARYQDGAVIVCISKPNFNQARPVRELSFLFISSIKNDLNKNGLFIVTVREGNGWNVPTTVYQLDATNPNKPVVNKQSSTR